MPKLTTITCDKCGTPITETDAMPRYRLRLTAEALPHTTNFAYAVLNYPPIDKDSYFCDLRCLANWVKDRDEKINGKNK